MKIINISEISQNATHAYHLIETEEPFQVRDIVTPDPINGQHLWVTQSIGNVSVLEQAVPYQKQSRWDKFFGRKPEKAELEDISEVETLYLISRGIGEYNV